MILFVIIAILLVFSLLTNSVEMKQHENGIRRLVGLTKHGYVTMILVQAFMFVLPSIVLAYFSSYLVLWAGYKYLLNFDMQYQTVIPGTAATYQALFVGMIIPIISSIIPVYRALDQ
jgi:ABC-type antimicrobial peptide transport system permease subunit